MEISRQHLGLLQLLRQSLGHAFAVDDEPLSLRALRQRRRLRQIRASRKCARLPHRRAQLVLHPRFRFDAARAASSTSSSRGLRSAALWDRVSMGLKYASQSTNLFDAFQFIGVM